MNKILVIKAGSTFPFIVSKRGDFEHWILGHHRQIPGQL
jgi:hypothetical protein